MSGTVFHVLGGVFLLIGLVAAVVGGGMTAYGMINENERQEEGSGVNGLLAGDTREQGQRNADLATVGATGIVTGLGTLVFGLMFFGLGAHLNRRSERREREELLAVVANR